MWIQFFSGYSCWRWRFINGRGWRGPSFLFFLSSWYLQLFPMDAASQRKGMFQKSLEASFLADWYGSWLEGYLAARARRGSMRGKFIHALFLNGTGPWTPGHLYLHLHSHITIPSSCHSSTTRGWRQGLRTTTFPTSRRVEKSWCGCKNIPNRLFNLITRVFFLDRWESSYRYE